MKTLIIFLSLAIPATAQVTVTIPPFTVSVDAATAVQKWMVAQVASTSTTLSLSAASSDHTITVASVTGIAAGKALVIDSEALFVIGVAGNVVSVTRGYLGTTAAAHPDAAPVQLLKYPTIGTMIYQMIASDVGAILKTRTDVGVVATNTAAIAAAQAAIDAAAAAAVQ